MAGARPSLASVGARARDSQRLVERRARRLRLGCLAVKPARLAQPLGHARHLEQFLARVRALRRALLLRRPGRRHYRRHHAASAYHGEIHNERPGRGGACRRRRELGKPPWWPVNRVRQQVARVKALQPRAAQPARLRCHLPRRDPTCHREHQQHAVAAPGVGKRETAHGGVGDVRAVQQPGRRTPTHRERGDIADAVACIHEPSTRSRVEAQRVYDPRGAAPPPARLVARRPTRLRLNFARPAPCGRLPLRRGRRVHVKARQGAVQVGHKEDGVARMRRHGCHGLLA